MTHLGERACTAWVSLYTRGLPAEAAERRREELGSDLFEHEAWAGGGPAHQRAVLGRVLWGIPADLSWRRAALVPRERRLQTGDPMNLRRSATVVAALVAAFDLWAGFGIFFLDESSSGRWQAIAVLIFLAGIVTGVGLWQWEDAPRRSTVLIVLGAAAPVAVFYWMLPIFLPLAALITWLVIAAEPGRRTPATVA